MKRLLSVCSLCCLLGITACSKPQTTLNSQDTPRLSITATFYPLYIMLLNCTENVPGIQLSLLAPPETGCLHDYQLTTKDMQTITTTDILVANGAGMEDFLDKALAEKKNAMIVAADGYPLIEDNAHVWVSVQGAIYEVQQIAKGLMRLDASYADQYQANAQAYCDKLTTLAQSMHSALDPYAQNNIITFHEAFPYFAAEFNLQTVAVIEREPGTIPSAKEMAEIIGTVKQQLKNHTHIALFAEEQYSSASADVIASETGLTVYQLDPCVTGTLDKNAYITAMETNTKVLQQALSDGGTR